MRMDKSALSNVAREEAGMICGLKNNVKLCTRELNIYRIVTAMKVLVLACPQKAGPLEKLGFTLEGEEPRCERASSRRSR